MHDDAWDVWRDIPLKAWYAALALGCFGVVAVGLMLQHLLSLAPCPLCIFQRLLYLLVGMLAVPGLLCRRSQPVVGRLILLVALAGVAVALWQTWMQAYPDLAPACNFADPNAIERLVYWLGGVWPDLFLATGLCTSRDWTLFGLSMANWSVFLFAGIAVYAALLARAGRR